MFQLRQEKLRDLNNTEMVVCKGFNLDKGKKFSSCKGLNLIWLK